LRKAVVFEGGVYGVQEDKGRAQLKGSHDLSIVLGRFHDSYRLQLARSSSHLWIAYGPQVYGWDGQRLQPSLVRKLVGTKDAIEWLGVCDDRAFFVKRTKRGDFSLYAIDSKGIAQFKKKFPYFEGRNQFVLCGHQMMHTSERNSDSTLVSLKSFKEKTLHLIHPNALQRGG